MLHSIQRHAPVAWLLTRSGSAILCTLISSLAALQGCDDTGGPLTGPDSTASDDGGTSPTPNVDDAGTTPSPEVDPNGPQGLDEGPERLYVVGTGEFQVFLNGVALGGGDAGNPFARAVALQPGQDNALAIKASRGTSANPTVFVHLEGDFGQLGSGTAWRARPLAQTGAATNNAWTQPDYDDSTWEAAQPSTQARPSGAPAYSPASPVWSQAAADTIVLRTVLYVPDQFAPQAPRGFGRQTRGGAGGETIRVSTPDALLRAVQGDTPRIIEIAGPIDFTGTEGTATTRACYQQRCPAPLQSELLSDQLGGCSQLGKATFNVNYDRAGVTPLVVGSNKTLLGVSTDAAIRGKGLTLKNGVRNIIIRNLTISDINPQLIWGGDALTIDGAEHVWVDHVRFARVGRQMLVTGYGQATHVTLSWNEFDGVTPYAAYCDGAHYWVWLLLGANDTITFDNNWVHNTSGRAPHAGGSGNAAVTAHLVNNFFDRVSGHAIDADTNAVRLLLEGNLFYQVERPIDASPDAPDNVYAPSPDTNVFAACQTALGRPCVANWAENTLTGASYGTTVLNRFAQFSRVDLPAPYPVSKVHKLVPHLAGPGHLPPPQ